MGGLMHERLNDAAQLGGGRRRHLRKNLSALGFIRLRFAGLRARAQALRLSGCDDYVPKPYSPRQLLAKIRNYLQ
jgi:DNA-binding response OmpR family regulator